nr:MAG: 5-methyltetrahydrofolate--homocysteine methyltransferase [Bacteroidota bacterium]
MSHPFVALLAERIVVFDGAMGTQIQARALGPEDFWGKEGCNELLVLSRPEVIAEIHAAYLHAGAMVIETNTFGANRVVLSEYGEEERTYEINRAAAALARRVAGDFHRLDEPRFVAGSIGPGTRLPTLGQIDFRTLRASYLEQALGLLDGGVDLFMIETCQDPLQIKAALDAVQEAMRQRGRRIPVIVSLTIEPTGSMLVGTDVQTALAILSRYELTALGLNCATGPEQMDAHLRLLAAQSPFALSCLPNAGLPENVGGRAVYRLSPEELARWMRTFVLDLGVQIVGGCCGTTPEHIRLLRQSVEGLAPRARNPEYIPSVTSLYQSLPTRLEPAPLLVGERLNANGSRQFRELLLAQDWEGMVQMAREQVREGAHLLDVCVAYVGRDERRDMTELVRRLVLEVEAPLMIDSTDPVVIEAALELIGGKAIVNSINFEDGEDRARRVLELCRRFGAAVVGLTIDERGMARSVEHKLQVAERLYRLAVEAYGLRPEELFIDPLTFTLGSGDEAFRRAALDTLQAIRQIKARWPRVRTILGISNVSFGLNPSARQALNSVFLHMAVEAGLDAAIVHASRIQPLHQIPEEIRELCRRLLEDDRRYDETGKLISDPLEELIAATNIQQEGPKREDRTETLSVEERLRHRILDGERRGLEEDLREALKRYGPLEIINTILLDAMRQVGELFGSGQMQLPFVLRSAEVMKAAVTYLEPFMERLEGAHKGTVVLATVRGDVHDIGKNLVDIILSNNGYRVINLGIKVPVEEMLAAAEAHRADAIGMSGLLVKSTAVMRENLEFMRDRGWKIPVLLGGAALTRRFVEEELRSLYPGPVFYCQDAFEGLEVLERLLGYSAAQSPPRQTEEETGYEPVEVSPPPVRGTKPAQLRLSTRPRARTEGLSPAPVPRPPFLGVRLEREIDLDTIYTYLNRTALIKGQWGIRAGNRNGAEFERYLEREIYPVLERLLREAGRDGWLRPAVAYGFFPVRAEGETLIVYRPGGMRPEEAPLREDWPGWEEFADAEPTEWLRFRFPRQRQAPYRCIADFFRSDGFDVLGVQLVTMGPEASAYAQRLFQEGRYQEYLYVHGFSVEMAEALAEYWHKRMRQMLDIAHEDARDLKALFQQGYRGSRYSFGYPACPNLEDQVLIMQLLRPERIGVGLTEAFQLVPEQSTSALVVHHPQAKYFRV